MNQKFRIRYFQVTVAANGMSSSHLASHLCSSWDKCKAALLKGDASRSARDTEWAAENILSSKGYRVFNDTGGILLQSNQKAIRSTLIIMATMQIQMPGSGRLCGCASQKA